MLPLKIQQFLLFTTTMTVLVHGQSSQSDGIMRDIDERNQDNSRTLIRSPQPPQMSSYNNFHVDVHTHPKTKFSCLGKQAGEYYADVEAQCAIYYVCIGDAKGQLAPISFACPNGTLFNQANKVCAQEEMVFCGLATRWYESVRGVIDSKGKDPRTVTTNNIRGQGSEQAWNHGGEESLAFRAPIIDQVSPARGSVQPQSAASDYVTGGQNQDAFRTAPARQSNPSNNQRNEWRQQQQPSASRSASLQASAPAPPKVLPANKPLINTRSRSAGRGQQYPPPTPKATTSTTTTTTTTTTAAPKGNNDYEYVDYEQPASGQPVAAKEEEVSEVAKNLRSKRSAKEEEKKRRKGKLITFESDFDTSSVSNVTSDTSSNFTCSDKVSRVAYADIASNCTKFHICLESRKGKMRDNVLNCKPGHGYSQEAGACLPIGSFDCINSDKFFVLNKSKSGGKSWKVPIEWTKKSISGYKL